MGIASHAALLEALRRVSGQSPGCGRARRRALSSPLCQHSAHLLRMRACDFVEDRKRHLAAIDPPAPRSGTTPTLAERRRNP